MRIISGDLKGSLLHENKDKITRPLKDLVRESIFNLLNHSNKLSFKLENSSILDLYSGTGSFGLECLSRKAKIVYFVENNKSAQKILKKNIIKLGIEKKTKIFYRDVFSLIKKKNIFKTKFNLIFCDPPFKNSNIEKLIRLIFDQKIIDKNGIFILHRNKNTKDILPNCLEILEERIYGISKIAYAKFLF